MLVLFGGPAGAGKSTLARAWCATRLRAVHIELDKVRSLIVSGLADPRLPGQTQAEQFRVSVRASCALAKEFLEADYDVAIDDVLFPDSFENSWRPNLQGTDWKVVIVQPSLAEALRRGAAREKSVPEHLVRQQYEATLGWPDECRVDTTGLSVGESLAMIEQVLAGRS